MMKKNKLIYSTLFAAFIAITWGQTSCTNDKLPNPITALGCDSLQVTYDNQIQPIIESTCALPGCHVSGGGAPGNYSDYAGLLPYLSDNEFKKFVITLKDDPNVGMPPNWSTNPGPGDLTDEQFKLVSCWVEDGYPEN